MPPVCPQAAAYANARPRRWTLPARAFERLRPPCAEAHLAITGVRTTRQQSTGTRPHHVPPTARTRATVTAPGHPPPAGVAKTSRLDARARSTRPRCCRAQPRPKNAIARFARARGRPCCDARRLRLERSPVTGRVSTRPSRARVAVSSTRTAQRMGRPRPRRRWARVASTPPRCDARRVAVAGMQAAAVRPGIRAAPRCTWTAASGPGSAADLHHARRAHTQPRAASETAAPSPTTK